MDSIFNAYIPMDRLHALACGRDLPDRAEGAVLFADVCGFSPLTEALVRELGPRRGAEELAARLNRVYDALIANVHHFGGSVLGFAGDAATCWFDDSHGLASARALNCALLMQQTMRGFENLDLKIGVASGPARRLLVGDPAIHYMDTLAGATLSRMAAAERLAREGEVVADAATVERLAQAARIREWRVDHKVACEFAVVEGVETTTPTPWPPMPAALDESRLRPWLPPSLYERLRGGMGEFLTELRSAAALFLRFEGIDYDADEAAGAKLDAYVRWVQKTIERYEGAVVQLIIGDKGSYLVAAFGAPVAHEDDARRAVAAALSITTPPKELTFIRPPQIGISQGIVRTGAYGGSARRTYGVLGDEVNLAARLMQHAAPGQVLVSGRVRKAALHVFAWESLPPLQVKGRIEPVTVYHPRGASAGDVRPATAMVGRLKERKILGERIQALRRRESSLILIEGEAGIGKSRLVDELLWQARFLGATVLVGAGDAVEQATSYHAWQGVFRQLLGLEKPADAAEAGLRHAGVRLTKAETARMLAELRNRAPELADLAPLLAVVLPADLPDNETTSAMNAQTRADKLQRLLLELLKNAARRGPLLLIMEDGHWLDSSSWALLRRAVQEIAPLFLAIVTRPPGEPPPSDYAQLLRLPEARLLRLGPLLPEAVETLLCERLGIAALPRPVVEFVREKAEGHPFFSEELACALRDAGLIQIEAGVCRLAPGAEDLRRFDFPDTIEGVIISRIDRLPPYEQLTLKVASVIGRLFAYRILLDIHPIEADKPRLLEELADLERLDLTPLDAPDPERAYLFKHIITQEVTYNLLSFAQRRELHRAVAEWYERNDDGDPSPHYPLLAHHWTRAENWSEACRYHGLAGDAAARLYAYAEARPHYAEALAALDRLPGGPDNTRPRVDLLIKLAAASIVAESPEANLERLAEAERLLDPSAAPDAEDRLRLARVHYWQGRSHYYQGNMREAMAAFQQTLAEAQDLGDQELLAMPASFIGQTLAAQGRFNQAEALLEQALEPLEQVGNWPDWIRTALFIGICKAARGHYAEGLNHVRRGLERATATRNVSAIGTCRILSWLCHFSVRNTARMQEEASEILQLAERSGDQLNRYWGYGFRGWTASLLGKLEAAAEDFARNQDLAEKLGGQIVMADWFAAAEAELALRRGRLEEALLRAEAATAFAEARGNLFACGLAQRAWGETLAAHDPPRWTEAEAHLAASLEALESGGAESEAARTRLAYGRLCRDRDERESARAHWRKAAVVFEAGGLQEEMEAVKGLIESL